jgi:chemotaxis protein CheZ
MPAARKGAKARAGAEKAVKVVSSVVPTTREVELFAELESLASYIQSVKSEIADIRPDEVKENYLPLAADELDAIVDATAEATNAIMDAAEIIEQVAGKTTADVSGELRNATTRIYESCGFQDITGQRITKVVRALKNIEEKVDRLMAAFGGETAPSASAKKPEKKKDGPITDENLLEGPQLKNKGSSQEEVDALLASFD